MSRCQTPLNDKVVTALERSPYLSRRNLRFETDEGRITLRGTVRSYFQKQMAQEASAKWTASRRFTTSWR